MFCYFCEESLLTGKSQVCPLSSEVNHSLLENHNCILLVLWAVTPYRKITVVLLVLWTVTTYWKITIVSCYFCGQSCLTGKSQLCPLSYVGSPTLVENHNCFLLVLWAVTPSCKIPIRSCSFSGPSLFIGKSQLCPASSVGHYSLQKSYTCVLVPELVKKLKRRLRKYWLQTIVVIYNLTSIF